MTGKEEEEEDRGSQQPEEGGGGLPRGERRDVCVGEGFRK